MFVWGNLALLVLVYGEAHYLTGRKTMGSKGKFTVARLTTAKFASVQLYTYSVSIQLWVEMTLFCRLYTASASSSASELLRCNLPH